jgi:glycosyltransferase involved in cell wall biosynthesis
VETPHPLTVRAEEATRPPRVAHVATIDLTVRVLLLPQLIGLRDAGFDVTAISAYGPMIPEVEAAGIQHIPWRNATRSWNLGADARAFAELLSILKAGRFDIVHTHNAKPGVMGRIGARLLGASYVVNTVHGFIMMADDPLPQRLAYFGAEWLAARFSHLELYQGTDDLRRARRARIVGGRHGVFLGNGIDLTRFDPAQVSPERRRSVRADLGFGPNDVVVGTVGRLVRDKGYRELFRAARAVRTGRPFARFLAIGGADPAKADAISAEELDEAAADVRLVGWREDVRDLLAAMDVFVLATWREGVPRSAIEAAAMGKPLVLTDIPGCRQVARNGIEACHVPVRDPDALAAAIVRLVDDPELRARMGAAARTRALSDFDERTIVATIVREYGALLRRNGRRP